MFNFFFYIYKIRVMLINPPSGEACAGGDTLIWFFY